MNKLVLAVVFALGLLLPPGTAQAHQPAKPAAEGHTDAPATAYEKQDAEHAGGEHGGLSALIWPTLNFAILAGGLWWFLKEPIATYLKDRHHAIRKDLVEAANIKAAATAELNEIDRKLAALPGEIEALKHRGAEEIAAEERRIAATAAAERDRLLEQTRREIELQVRLAKRALVEHAADLAVQLATERIEKTITPSDQDRLVDRYLKDVSAATSVDDRSSKGGAR